MDCPKCGRNAEQDDAICGGCDFILDTSFLGVGFVDDEQSQRLHKALDPNEATPWDEGLGGDSLILGNLSDYVASFRTSDTGIQEERRAMHLSVGTAIQAMLSPHAVPVVQHSAMSGSVRLNPFERHVLTLTDGTQPVARIFQQSGLNREELYTTLATLADKGYLSLQNESTVIAPSPFARHKGGSILVSDDDDEEEEEENATEVADMADRLQELRALQPGPEEGEDPRAIEDSGDVFAEASHGVELHRVDDDPDDATVAEISPQLSAEDLPSLEAEARALAFADELISGERTHIEEVRISSRSKGTRSGGGRAGRAPPPLPKRPDETPPAPPLQAQTGTDDAPKSQPVESAVSNAPDLGTPSESEDFPAVAPHGADNQTEVAESPVGSEGISVDISSVFGPGHSPAPPRAREKPTEGPDAEDGTNVFASVSSLEDASSAVEFPSVFPTLESQEQLASTPSEPGDTGAADISDAASQELLAPEDEPHPEVDEAAKVRVIEELPPAAPDIPGAEALLENVFANASSAADVRPAARSEQHAEDPRPSPTKRPVARIKPAVSFEYRRKAEKIFEEAEADYAAGRLGSARMNARLASIYNPQESRYGAALARWEEMSMKNLPSAPKGKSPNRILVDEAKRAENQGDYEAAIGFMRQALENDPDAAPLLNHLGVLLATRVQQFQEASVLIMRAIELAPQNLAYKNNLGKILAAQAENDDAKPRKWLLGRMSKESAVRVKNIRPKVF